MSVNVALEDVPWAILEMVKARIMRNRRDLELSEDVQEQTTTKPVTALQSIGARGKRWGEEEPAATLDPVKKSRDWVIYWTADGGRTTVSPAELVQTGEYLTVEFQGQLARAGAADVEGAFFEASIDDVLLIGEGNFTFEGWMAEGSTDADNLSGRPEGVQDGDAVIITNVGIGFTWDGGEGGFIQLNIFRNYIVATDQNVYRRTGTLVTSVVDRVSLTSDVPATAGEPVRHFCYQRIGPDSYFHFNGIPQPASYGAGGPRAVPVGGRLQMFAGMQTKGTLRLGTITGQARVKQGALYGAGAFTPPAAPFFNP